MKKLVDLLTERFGELTSEVLEARTIDILNLLSDEQFVKYTQNYYNEIAEIYADDFRNREVPPELLDFMDLLHNDALVLDLGCGQGRDTKYMISKEGREKGLTNKEFRVVPYDISTNLIRITLKKILDRGINGEVIDYRNKIPALVEGDFTAPGGDFLHFYCSYENKDIFQKMFEEGNPKPIFDGIWANLSLLVHTPLYRLENAVRYWGGTLKEEGLFVVSYPDLDVKNSEIRLIDQNKYKLSFGEINSYLKFTPVHVQSEFAQAGMELLQRKVCNTIGRNILGERHIIADFYRKLPKVS